MSNAATATVSERPRTESFTLDELEAMPAPSLPRSCACGRHYDAAAWAMLPCIGRMPWSGDEELELRNCPCTSTIGIGVPR